MATPVTKLAAGSRDFVVEAGPQQPFERAARCPAAFTEPAVRPLTQHFTTWMTAEWDEAAVNGLHLKVRLSQVLSERTNAGLTAAAAGGRKGGRPMAATPERVVRARQLIASGLTFREAAARVKVGKSALYAALRVTDTPLLN